MVDDDNDGNIESSSLFGSDVIFGKKSKRLLGNDEESAQHEMDQFHQLDFPVATEIMLCNSVTIKGTKYIPGNNNPLHTFGYDSRVWQLVKIWSPWY